MCARAQVRRIGTHGDFQVHDLRNNSMRTWLGNTTSERLGNTVGLFVTETLGGYATETDFWLADFGDIQQSHLIRVRVPEHRRYVSAIAACDQQVAALVILLDESDPGCIIWLYNHFDQSTCSFKIPVNIGRDEKFVPIGMHLAQHRIPIFYEVQDDYSSFDPDPDHVRKRVDGVLWVRSFSLAGQSQWSKTFSFSRNEYRAGLDSECNGFLNNNVLETGAEDVFAVRVSRWDSRRQIVDLRHGILTLHDFKTPAAYWKDTLYHIDQFDDDRYASLMDSMGLAHTTGLRSDSNQRCTIGFCRRMSNRNHVAWRLSILLEIEMESRDRGQEAMCPNGDERHIFVSNSHLVVIWQMGSWSWMHAFSFNKDYRNGAPLVLAGDRFTDEWSWMATRDQGPECFGSRLAEMTPA